MSQINALLRKSVAYQRKNICQNICITAAPIVICVLLFILQLLIDNLISSIATCGCKCLECELPSGEISTDEAACNTQSSGTEIECKRTDKTQCSAEFSSPAQIGFCQVLSPSLWPPVFELTNALQNPPSAEAPTAAPSPPEADDDYDYDFTVATPSTGSLYFSSGGNEAFVDGMMAKYFRQPDLQAIFAAFDGAQAAPPAGANLTTDLSFYSAANVDLGAANQSLVSLYLDSGVFANPFFITNNCAQLNGVLSSVGLSLDAVKAIFGTCTDGASEMSQSVDAINEELYCTDPRAVGNGNCAEGIVAYGDSFDWRDTAAGQLHVDIYHNDRQKIGGAPGPGLTTLKRIFKPLDRAMNLFLEAWVGQGYTARLLSLLEMPKPQTSLNLDISSLAGVFFFLILIQLPLPLCLSQLVYEKENRLRMMMRMHGLSNGVYIAVMYLYFFLLHVVYFIVTVAIGVALGLNFFRRNGIDIQIVFFLLYSNVQIAQAFLLSVAFTNTKTATNLTYVYIFSTSLLGSFLLEPFFNPERWFTFVLQLLPSFGAYRALWELAQYAFNAEYQNKIGMTLANTFGPQNGTGIVLIIFLIEWPLFMLLAWYLEQVVGTGIGVRRSWLFFLPGSRDNTAKKSSSVTPGDDPAGTPADVVAERERALATDPTSDTPIVLRQLRKLFPGVNGQPEKLAVDEMSLAVSKGECFGLLGPNGAGKSTAINMMIGFLEATSGTAHIMGKDIATEMDEIYRVMGVCPQHDLLWETLTAREHLNFYGRLKGLANDALKGAVETALKGVRLFEVQDKRVGQFSGGMKRRLSVAISLIGAPSVTYLDEPSTGLDPASRRNLWDVVRDAKRDKAVILTTHSMQEAEVLCDRLGIFVNGRLVCIGNPKQITAARGGYYVLTITVAPESTGDVAGLVESLSPGARQTYSLGGSFKYEIPSANINLSTVFEQVQAAREEGLKVIDWGIHNASLEDVFIQLAQDTQSQAESSQIS